MSTSAKSKKGVRTFASDFARVKETNVPVAPKKPADTKPAVKATTDQKPAAVPKTPTASKSPEAPNKIPAFHELQQAVGAIDLSDADTKSDPHPTKKASSKKDIKGIQPTKHVGGGAIITDTKQSSFSLFGESKKSLGSWFSNLQKKKKRAPKLALPTADLRKGVIQEATTKTGTIFTADNDTLKERIKARERQAAKAEADPETNWSPYTETGYDLLEAGDDPAPPVVSNTPENVSVAFKKRTIPKEVTPVAQPVVAEQDLSAVVLEPVVTKEVPDTRWSDSKLDKKDSHTESREPEASAWSKQSELSTDKKISSKEESNVLEQEPKKEEGHIETTQAKKPKAVTTPVVEEPAKVAPKPAQPKLTTTKQTSRLTTQGDLSTNQLTLYILGGILFVLIAAFLAWAIFAALQPDTPTASTTTTETRAIDREPVVVDQSYTVETLRAYTNASASTEVVLINENKEVLPTAFVFNLLIPELSADIRRYATDVRFIQVDGSTPQLVISITDPVSVHGAMLQHEAELPAIFAPLYNTNPQGTFTDNTLATLDTRSFVDTNDSVSLTYSIVGEQLIIAATPELFVAVSALTN